jgi:phospholipid-translocating ATPase
MVFRQCCVGGKVYRGDPNVESEAQKPVLPLEVKPNPDGGVADAPFANDSGPQEGSSTSSSNPSPVAADQIKLSKGVLHRFRDSDLMKDLAEVANPTPENESFARTLNGFFVVLALCHTVLTTVDPETGAIEYQAQSPDEAALVQAAADVGFVFRGRERETLSLQTPFSDEIEKYELLNILEFTSTRKRMSVVVRKMNGEDQRLLLLTKGADSVIFERLKSGAEDLKKEVERRLDEFASEGLRTLTLAYKVIAGSYGLFFLR